MIWSRYEALNCTGEGCRAVMDRPRVVIVGAGIGGLAAHLVCAQVGCTVEHFERQTQLTPAGAALILWPNGVKILQSLGLGERLSQIGCAPTRLVVRSQQDQILNELPLDALSRDIGAPTLVVSRTDLQALLLGALDLRELRLGADCISIEMAGEEVVASFADGRRAAGELVVGADGIHSAVRRSVIGEVAPRYAGFAASVGIMSNDDLVSTDVALEFLGEGQRCGLLPISGERIYYSFAFPWKEQGATPAEGWKCFLDRLFAGWPSPVREVINRLGQDAPLHLEIHDLPPLPAWTSKGVALLGDAAHATTPTLGQGACQALEDAATLGRCLGGPHPDLGSALAEYELRRKQRADRIVSLARQGAVKMHAPSPDVYQDLYRRIHASSMVETMGVAERWLAQGPVV